MQARKVVTLLLALVLTFMFFAVPAHQHANAIAGTVIIGAVIVVMAMAGITFAAAGITSAQLQDWVGGKLDEWAQYRGQTLDNLIGSSLIGTTISGLLMIGKAAADGINDFISWLRTDQSLTDNNYVNVISGGSTLGELRGIVTDNIVCTYVNHYDYTNQTMAFTTSIPIFFALSSDGTLCGFSQQGFTYTQNGYGPYNAQLRDYIYSYYYDPSITHVLSANPATMQNDKTFSQMINYLDRLYSWNIETSGSLTIGTQVINPPTVQTDEKIFLDVGALPGSTVTEVTDGVINDVIDDTLVVSGEVAEAEPEYELTGPERVNGLTEVFPLCIPFDIYHFFECLAADPVAPSFTWRFYVPNIVDEEIEIDLAQFETVAQVLRTFELLAFCVGLAFETRKLLRS